MGHYPLEGLGNHCPRYKDNDDDPLVLTQPVVGEEILLTPIGTHGPKIRTIETIMEKEEGLD
jgi:hypothetical protein